MSSSSSNPYRPAMPPVTVSMVRHMFPATPAAPIVRHLPEVLAALEQAGLTAPGIVLTALATIRAETEGFEPIAEGISRYNTNPGGRDFDRYDRRTDLGNRGAPDGATYKGRGFVQLTGRYNYERFGKLIGMPDLMDDPDRACDPEIAAKLLAAFLKAQELPIARALAAGNLAAVRRCVNGGSNGLDRFIQAYTIGAALLQVTMRGGPSAIG